MLKTLDASVSEAAQSNDPTSIANSDEPFEALLLFGLNSNNDMESKEAAYVLHILKHVCGIKVETLADGVVSLRLPKPSTLHS